MAIGKRRWGKFTSKGDDSNKRAPKATIKARVTVDAKSRPATIRIDLDKKISKDKWEEWELLLLGDEDDEGGVEGVARADHEDGYSIDLELANFHRPLGRAKKVAANVIETLGLKSRIHVATDRD